MLLHYTKYKTKWRLSTNGAIFFQVNAGRFDILIFRCHFFFRLWPLCALFCFLFGFINVFCGNIATPFATSCLLAYLLLQVPHRGTGMKTFICAIPCGNLEPALSKTPDSETADD